MGNIQIAPIVVLIPIHFLKDLYTKKGHTVRNDHLDTIFLVFLSIANSMWPTGLNILEKTKVKRHLNIREIIIIWFCSQLPFDPSMKKKKKKKKTGFDLDAAMGEDTGSAADGQPTPTPVAEQTEEAEATENQTAPEKIADGNAFLLVFLGDWDLLIIVQI